MIEIINLTKKYGHHSAVKSLSFTLEHGKIYALLGPNGAGKSTTLNIMTGCLAPTDGQVIINGFDITKDAVKAKRNIGYLPETPPLYFDMTPREYLRFVASAKGLTDKDASKEADRVMECTDIIEVKDRLIRHLSKGFCQRIGIAQALIGSPEYIILDEPTVGLDPNQMIEIRELIKSLGNEHTVLLSSHILSEVSNICDEIIVISNGNLLACDTPENLSSKFTVNNTLRLTLKSNTTEKIVALLSEIDGVSDISILSADEGYSEYKLSISEKDIRETIFYRMAENKTAIVEMQMSRLSLEDVFIELTSTDEPTEDTVIEDTNNENSYGGEEV